MDDWPLHCASLNHPWMGEDDQNAHRRSRDSMGVASIDRHESGSRCIDSVYIAVSKTPQQCEFESRLPDTHSCSRAAFSFVHRFLRFSCALISRATGHHHLERVLH